MSRARSRIPSLAAASPWFTMPVVKGGEAPRARRAASMVALAVALACCVVGIVLGAMGSSPTIEVVEASSREGVLGVQVETIRVGRYPTGIGFDPSSKDIYVSSRDDGRVSVIDGVTLDKIAAIRVRSRPFYGIAFDPTQNRAYVANNGDRSVSVIDTVNNEVVETLVGVGDYPEEVAVSLRQRKLYVSHDGNAIESIDLDTHARGRFSTGPWNHRIGILDSLDRAYVSMSDPDQTMMMDLAESTIAQRIRHSGHPVTDSVNNRVFLIDFRVPRVTVIDPDGDQIDQLTLLMQGGLGAYDSERACLYVTHGDRDRVSIVNAVPDMPLSIEASVRVGRNPVGIAIHPITHQVFVANSESDTVSVFDGADCAAAIASPTATASATVEITPTPRITEEPTPSAVPSSTQTPTATVPLPASPTYTSTIPAPTDTATPRPPTPVVLLPYLAKAQVLVVPTPTVTLTPLPSRTPVVCASVENEPNDSPRDALGQPVICAGQTLRGALLPGAEPDAADYFTMLVDEEHNARIVLDPGGIRDAVEYDLGLWSCLATGCTQVGFSGRVGRAIDEIRVHLLPGRYFVDVRPRTSVRSVDAYTLRWDVVP